MILRLSLDLPEESTYIRTTRLLARCLLEDIGVQAAIIHDTEYIVGELCSNVIRHAESKSARFLLTVEFYMPKIIITVTDKGKGFVKDEEPEPGTVRSDGEGKQRIGGFGFVLLEGLSDKIDYSETDPHGMTVRVEKKLLYDSVEEANDAADKDSSSGGSVTVETS